MGASPSPDAKLGTSAPEKRTIHELARVSPGSAGIDLPASQFSIITPENEVTLISTGVYGPLPLGYMGLIIGRSSTSKSGISVIPGVIDSEYTGELKIMIQPPRKTIQIHLGQKIAQLLILPYLSLPNFTLKGERGDQGSGSTDLIAWVQKVSAQRPMRELYVEGKKIEGLIDTGADVSCIAGKDWPNAWPTVRSASTLIGLGLASNIAKSSNILHWKDSNKEGTFQPYIIPSLPFTLWGRDILSQMDMVLEIPDKEPDFL